MKKIPSYPVYKVFSLIRSFFKQLYSRMMPHEMMIIEKVTAVWMAKMIGVACRLNLADILRDRSLHVEDIAAECGCDPAALYRFMRSMAGEGFFRETEDHVFSNTTLSEYLAEGEKSIKYFVMHEICDVNFRLISEMVEGIRSGQSVADKVLGMSVFEYLEKHPETNTLYNRAMSESSALLTPVLLASYDFRGIRTLVDIGGGEGFLLLQVLETYPSMKGVLYDLPHVVKTPDDKQVDPSVRERLQVMSGDFFKEMPPEGDAYLLKNILHIFNDEQSLILLRKIRDKIAPEGKIIVIESIIGDRNTFSFGNILDMQMLLGTVSGRERTEKEYRTLFEKAGFRCQRVIHTVSPFSVMEGVPTD